jgi:hypothetical protein
MTELNASLFMRKPNVLPGHKVTPETIDWIANWCQGKILPNLETGKPFIRVPTSNPGQDRTRYEAQLGQWILRVGRGYSVYSQSYISKNFIDIPNEVDLGSAVQLTTRVVTDEEPPVIPEQAVHHCCHHEPASNVHPFNAPGPKKYNHRHIG